MITNSVIQALYRKYRRRPTSVDTLDIHLLYESAHISHAVSIEDETLYIHSIPENNPFHAVNINHIHAIVEFEESVAIVLHSSILFLNKTNNDVKIHIKPIKDSLWNRIKDRF